MMIEKMWVIWSNQHGLYWRPDSRGYTSDIGQAGRYSETEANQICDSGGPVSPPDELKFLAPEIFEEHKRLLQKIADRNVIFEALKAYRMKYLAEDDGTPYALTDLLTPQGATVDVGEDEAFLIADFVASEISKGDNGA